MLIKSILLICISVCCLTGEEGLKYPHGWAELQSDAGWEVVSENEKVKVYAKTLSVSPLNAFKAELKTRVDRDKLVETAWLVEESTTIFPDAFISEAGVFQHISATRYFAYQVIDIPILDPRLYRFNSHLQDSTIHWVAADFEFVEEEKKEMVIPNVNFGSWDIVSGGEQNTVIYRVCTDPGGYVPSWIVEKANQRYLPQMMLDLESFAEKR